jgi:hypothetical protein
MGWDFDSTSRSRLLEIPHSDASEGCGSGLDGNSSFYFGQFDKRKYNDGSHTNARGYATYSTDNVQRA